MLKMDLPDDPAATERLGALIGARLRAGAVVALTGPMGAGKTCLTRGLARGLGVDDPDGVSSPTYLLVIEHGGEPPLVHADAYLPEKLQAFLEDGGLEYLFDDARVAVVEWADKIANILPENTLWISMGHGDGRGRSVQVGPCAPADEAWLAEVFQIFRGG